MWPTSHFALHFITTTAGKKHEITTNACMVGSSLMLNFLVHNDFSNLRGQSQGNVALDPASARSDYLFMTSAPQNLSTPSRSDKWDPMHWQSNIDTVGLDAVLTPTGGLHWMNGGGGIVLEANSVIPDQFAGFPGYSWYWVSLGNTAAMQCNNLMSADLSSRGTRICASRVPLPLMA